VLQFACNRCGKKIGDHDYTVHIIRHAFQDMETSPLINVTKYHEAERQFEHLAN
jgi:hypothetical protein